MELHSCLNSQNENGINENITLSDNAIDEASLIVMEVTKQYKNRQRSKTTLNTKTSEKQTEYDKFFDVNGALLNEVSETRHNETIIDESETIENDEVQVEVLKEKSVVDMEYFLDVYNQSYSNHIKKLDCDNKDFKFI